MAYNFDCRFFTGYKPCKFKRPCEGCQEYDPIQTRVCVVSLEALGAVLRSTILLEPLRREYPNCHITWITYPSAKSLLEHNPHIDRLLVLDGQSAPLIEYLEFDLLMSVDKSMEAGALAERIKAKRKLGFGLSPHGVIRPLNEEASYQYALGLDNYLKFKVNTKPETQQTTETMALTWKRDEYILALTPTEKAEVAKRRRLILQEGTKGIIGFNTGCSILYPYKKFTIDHSASVISMWRKAFPNFTIALLGGKEDSERQARMKEAFQSDNRVVNTPTGEGLRSGMLWMDTADIVLSGCSLGMHIAIALKKHVIAWFGVSCIQEVDLYDRGVKLQSEVSCSPCWQKACDNEPKCFDQVSTIALEDATRKIIREIFP